MKSEVFPMRDPARLRKGQSLVEFALAATLIIFMLVATIDFGLAFFAWIELRDAAQEGATLGSMFPPISSTDAGPMSNIKARIWDAASTPIDLSTIPDDTDHIKINVSNSFKACAGQTITVTLVYDYHVITPMISTFIGSPTIPVSATVTNTILRNGHGETCP